jgi:hypothetical protein
MCYSDQGNSSSRRIPAKIVSCDSSLCCFVLSIRSRHKSWHDRFPQQVRDKLRAWFEDHIDHPFPSREFHPTDQEHMDCERPPNSNVLHQPANQVQRRPSGDEARMAGEGAGETASDRDAVRINTHLDLLLLKESRLDRVSLTDYQFWPHPDATDTGNNVRKRKNCVRVRQRLERFRLLQQSNSEWTSKPWESHVGLHDHESGCFGCPIRPNSAA